MPRVPVCGMYFIKKHREPIRASYTDMIFKLPHVSIATLRKFLFKLCWRSHISP